MPRSELDAESLKTAARHLVANPLSSARATDRETFASIRRHRDALTAMFDDLLSWRLIVSDHGARLFKTGVDHRADRRQMVAASPPRPFTTKHYVALVLVFAVCEAHDRDWITVKDLHDRLNDLSSNVERFGWNPEESKPDRYLLGAVLRTAAQIGVLRLEEGDEGRVMAGDRGADALYLIDRWALSMLLATQIAPSLTDSIEDLRSRERHFDNLGALDDKALLRRQVMRRLVEDPMVDLTDREDHEVDHVRRTLRKRIEEPLDAYFGLHVEARAEGLLAVDEDGALTDSAFPGTSTTAHIALLLAGWLESHIGEAVSFDDIDHQVEEWAANEYGRFWSKRALSGDARTREALTLLADHHLVTWDLDAGTVVPHAPIARYRDPDQTLHHRQETLL